MVDVERGCAEVVMPRRNEELARALVEPGPARVQRFQLERGDGGDEGGGIVGYAVRDSAIELRGDEVGFDVEQHAAGNERVDVLQRGPVAIRDQQAIGLRAVEVDVGKAANGIGADRVGELGIEQRGRIDRELGGRAGQVEGERRSRLGNRVDRRRLRREGRTGSRSSGFQT
jgi:hypothetical protein